MTTLSEVFYVCLVTDPVKVLLQSSVYLTPILNGEMGNVVQQINETNDTIKNLRIELINRQNQLNSLNSQLLSMYIQQTGSFPS